jgi:hypothetical protein
MPIQTGLSPTEMVREALRMLTKGDDYFPAVSCPGESDYQAVFETELAAA